MKEKEARATGIEKGARDRRKLVVRMAKYSNDTDTMSGIIRVIMWYWLVICAYGVDLGCALFITTRDDYAFRRADIFTVFDIDGHGHADAGHRIGPSLSSWGSWDPSCEGVNVTMWVCRRCEGGALPCEFIMHDAYFDVFHGTTREDGADPRGYGGGASARRFLPPLSRVSNLTNIIDGSAESKRQSEVAGRAHAWWWLTAAVVAMTRWFMECDEHNTLTEAGDAEASGPRRGSERATSS
jgi:hypothetical protein